MLPVGILLAAGRGRRFDPSGARNKLLQPLHGGESVVASSARTLLKVLERVVAVVAPHDGGVGAQLLALGCEVTVCPDADSGMGTSLAHALRHAHPTSCLIALGDMPHLQASTVRALCDALDGGAGIAAPVCGGRRGNPVAFSAAYVPQLFGISGDQGARALLKSQPVTEVEVADPGIFQDIDLASDL
ncbi:MAG: nucleotidyltransferase family protein [Pseudomonadota bacterium]